MMRPAGEPLGKGAVIVVVSPFDARLELLCEWLVEHGYCPVPAEKAPDAMRLCRYTRPALIVVDLDLPHDSGLDLLRKREEADFLDIPVLLLIERGFDVRALIRRDPLLSVDDALDRPFDLGEFGRRIVAILRRQHSRGDAIVRVGELLIDPPRRKVRVGDREVHLAKKEFSLLRVLATDPTRVFSKDELLTEVWGLRAGASTRTLDSHASRLRTKLDPEHRRFVVVSWGVGYRLVESLEAAGLLASTDAEGEPK